MIRVELEETQDHVCGMLAISGEEAEELAFVPSVLSEPRGSIYFCDNRSSEKAVRYWQCASLVVEEGGEAHTQSICVSCATVRKMVKQGKPRLILWQWRAVVERKAHRGRISKIMGNQPIRRGMWECFTFKIAEAKKIVDDAARDRQEGIQGQWQQGSPFREILEPVRGNVRAGCGHQMMRKNCIAKRDGSWSSKKDKKSTDFLRRVIAPVGGRDGVTLSCICPQCSSFPLEDHIWCVSIGHGDSNNRKKEALQLCGGKYEWRLRRRFLVVQLGTNEK